MFVRNIIGNWTFDITGALIGIVGHISPLVQIRGLEFLIDFLGGSLVSEGIIDIPGSTVVLRDSRYSRHSCKAWEDATPIMIKERSSHQKQSPSQH